MEKHALLLRASRGTTNDMDHRNMLGKRPGKAVDGRKLTNTKRCDHSTNGLDTSVAISSISYKTKVQLRLIEKIRRFTNYVPAFSSLTLPTHFK